MQLLVADDAENGDHQKDGATGVQRDPARHRRGHRRANRNFRRQRGEDRFVRPAEGPRVRLHEVIGIEAQGERIRAQVSPGVDRARQAGKLLFLEGRQVRGANSSQRLGDRQRQALRLTGIPQPLPDAEQIVRR